MKRCGAILVAMLVAFHAGATTNVTSVNAVGFIRVSINDNGWGVVSVPFENLNGSGVFTISDILPAPVEDMQAYVYRNGVWRGGIFDGEEWEGHPDFLNAELIRGDAIFVKSPATGDGVKVVVMGEVPDKRSVPTEYTDYVLAEGWSLTGYSYPTDMAFTDMAISTVAEEGDQVYWWDPSRASGKGAWVGMIYDGEEWEAGPGASLAKVFQAGEGLFYLSQSAKNWTEKKLYVWP